MIHLTAFVDYTVCRVCILYSLYGLYIIQFPWSAQKKTVRRVCMLYSLHTSSIIQFSGCGNCTVCSCLYSVQLVVSFDSSNEQWFDMLLKEKRLCIALFVYCIISKLHYICIALYLYCTISVCTISVLYFIFFAFYLYCTISVLHYSHLNCFLLHCTSLKIWINAIHYI